MFRNKIGQVEKVSLQQFGIGETLAKVDTGAYYCRIHCDSERRGKDGKIYFTILGRNYVACSYKPNMRVLTKGITGHEKRERAIISDIMVKGRKYQTVIVLSKRDDRNYKILLGRKFLLDNGFVVDVRRGIKHDVEHNRKAEK
jgi:hypothetical protein